MSDPTERDISIDDRRVDEIFDARREAATALTRAQYAERVGNAEDVAHGLTAAHGALKAYIIQSEDIIRDGSEEAARAWRHAPLGTIYFKKGDDSPTIRIRGLADLLDLEPVITREWDVKGTGFMKGEMSTKRATKTIPINTLWQGYRLTTSLLADRGFEIEAIEENEWEI